MTDTPRELTSPLNPALLDLRVGDDRMLQVRRPLSPDDIRLLDHFLLKWPRAWLNVYRGVGQAPQDWTWLSGLTNLKRLVLSLRPEDAIDFTFLATLPVDLESLYLPPDVDWTKHLGSVLRLAKLREVAVTGREPPLGELASLDELRSLKFFRSKQLRVVDLSACRGLKVLDVENTRSIELDGIERLSQLEELRLVEARVRGLPAIAECAVLKRLELVNVKCDSELQRLDRLERLCELRIASISPRYCAEHVFAAPKLVSLSLDCYESDCKDEIPQGMRRIDSLTNVYLGVLNPTKASKVEAVLGRRLARDQSKLPFGIWRVHS